MKAIRILAAVILAAVCPSCIATLHPDGSFSFQNTPTAAPRPVVVSEK